MLIHCTRRSRLTIAAGMDHQVKAPGVSPTTSESSDDRARITVTAHVAPGQSLSLVKFVAYGWSSQRSTPALRAQIEGALETAKNHGWKGLVSAQRKYLSDFWGRADVELTGDPEVQQAIRFVLFHVL